MLTKLRERQNQRAPELASHRGLQGDLVLTNPGNCRYQTHSRPYHQFSISSVHLAELCDYYGVDNSFFGDAAKLDLLSSLASWKSYRLKVKHRGYLVEDLG